MTILRTDYERAFKSKQTECLLQLVIVRLIRFLGSQPPLEAANSVGWKRKLLLLLLDCILVR